MEAAELIRLALGKPGAFLCFPFGPTVSIVKVQAPDNLGPARIFLQVFTLKGTPSVTFSCRREEGELWRAQYPDTVTRGWHCPPVQQPFFNTAALDALPDEVLSCMLDQAYDAVYEKLPLYARKALSRPQDSADGKEPT